MTIRTHTTAAHTTDVCTATGTGHMHRSGYTTARGAQRWVDTHTAPRGRTYVVRTEHGIPGAADDAHAVWCVPTYTDAHGNALTDRYGMPVVDVDGTTAYVATADGMGYASTGTNTYGAPTVPATDTTPWFDRDTADADTDPDTGVSYLDAPTADADTDTTHDRHGDPIAHVDAEGNEVTMESGEIVAQGNERDYRGWAIHADGTYTRYDASGWTWYRSDDTVIHAHTYGPVAGTDTTDDDTYVTVFGRPVRAHVARSMGVVDPAPWSGPIPGRTYTGTSRNGTPYTMTTDGTTTTRAYADGTVTHADANHMWTDTDAGTVTYVVAEGTYWRVSAADAFTYDRVSSASWPMVATCMHNGDCIAPVGHPGAHRTVYGPVPTRPAMARYAAPIGPTHPTTYTRVVTRVPMHRDTYRTVLRADVADMARDYATTYAAIGGHVMTLGAAYAAIVNDMPHGTYDPHPHHYAAWSHALDAHYGTDHA